MLIANSLSSLSIDPRSDLGIATQIRARIAFLVADGELAPGERLPSVRGLAAQLGVNVNTIRAAYAELDRDGLVRTRHGVGTVVLAAPPARLPAGVRPLGVNTVAVLIGGLNPFYLDLLRGIEDVASGHGTLVLIVDTHDSPPLAEATLRRLIARGVDGIIAVSVGGLANGPESRETDDGRLPPIVYVDQPDRRGHVLLFDGHAAGYAATHHLHEHGHERIGIITAPRSSANVYEVYSGYVDALHDTGRQLDSNLIAEVDAFTIETGRLGLAHLLASARPTLRSVRRRPSPRPRCPPRSTSTTTQCSRPTRPLRLHRHAHRHPRPTAPHHGRRPSSRNRHPRDAKTHRPHPRQNTPPPPHHPPGRTNPARQLRTPLTEPTTRHHRGGPSTVLHQRSVAAGAVADDSLACISVLSPDSKIAAPKC